MEKKLYVPVSSNHTNWDFFVEIFVDSLIFFHYLTIMFF